MATNRIIDRNLASWDGSPTTLEPNAGVKMDKTPVGKIIVAYKNQSTQPNEGMISVTSGGSQPQFYSVEALLNAPTFFVSNFEGNNLSITNISTSATIWIEALGPGLKECRNLPIGEPTLVEPYGCVSRRSNPNYMRLSVRAPGQYSTAAVYIGSDPSVYAINSPDPTKVPPGYDKVTSANEITDVGNWNGKTVWMGNLSADTAEGETVTIIDL